MFSGLNLALLSISRLRLEVEAASDNPAAKKILSLRQDFNFLLTTILWGNVAINVVLTLISKSVMAGVSAFFFSTIVITFFGEITPQAYFSRNAMRMGSLLYPVMRFYQVILYPVAKPSAWILDRWLGNEGIRYFRERDLRAVIHKHIEADESDIDRLEGIGALNFLALDDVPVTQEGEEVDPKSVISLPSVDRVPQFPSIERKPDDPFLHFVAQSQKKWIIIVDENKAPLVVLNANIFLRDALFGEGKLNPLKYCHRPIIVSDGRLLLGNVLPKLRAQGSAESDDVVEHDLILLWSSQKRVITGSDILGRLLRGIALHDIAKSETLKH